MNAARNRRSGLRTFLPVLIAGTVCLGRTAEGSIDLTGGWNISGMVDTFPIATHWVIIQTGASLAISNSDLGTPPFNQQAVATVDQLTGETVELQKLKFVCVPVDKNGEGINDAATHLACYQIKGEQFSPRPQGASEHAVSGQPLRAQEAEAACRPPNPFCLEHGSNSPCLCISLRVIEAAVGAGHR